MLAALKPPAVASSRFSGTPAQTRRHSRFSHALKEVIKARVGRESASKAADMQGAMIGNKGRPLAAQALLPACPLSCSGGAGVHGCIPVLSAAASRLRRPMAPAVPLPNRIRDGGAKAARPNAC